MNAAIKQTVIVQAGGVVHFASPELHEGTQAEVIVLLTQAPLLPEPQRRLAAFRSLQQSLALTPDTAKKWMTDTSAERSAFGPP